MTLEENVIGPGVESSSDGMKDRTGPRTSASRKHAADGRARVTVVTVVFNCADSLEATLLSVINQSYANVEYIVVDGGSTDGTVEIIRKYDQYIDKWISEKDSGIYNAMNKGIDLSTGGWINFMNAGDCFQSDKTIENVVDSLDESFAIVAGGVCYVYDGNNRRVKHMQAKFSGFNISVPHHQASFINNKLMKKFRYDESFRIKADLNLVTTMRAHGHDFKFVKEVICNVDTNGISSGLSWVHISEEIRAGSLVVKHYWLRCLVYHAIYSAPRLLLRKLLPKQIESKIRSLIRN